MDQYISQYNEDHLADHLRHNYRNSDPTKPVHNPEQVKETLDTTEKILEKLALLEQELTRYDQLNYYEKQQLDATIQSALDESQDELYKIETVNEIERDALTQDNTDYLNAISRDDIQQLNGITGLESEVEIGLMVGAIIVMICIVGGCWYYCAKKRRANKSFQVMNKNNNNDSM